jgi:hypothetical protein
LQGDAFLLTVRDSGAFTLSRGGAELRFRFVDMAERWVSNAVIAGKYRDASGATYTFDRDGRAVIPGQKPFRYTLAMDHVLNPYDYVYSDLAKLWAISITRQSISLNDVSGDHEQNVSTTPRWKLTRLTPPDCH